MLLDSMLYMNSFAKNVILCCNAINMDGEHISPLFYLLMWKGGEWPECVLLRSLGEGD